jgi:hypothetical protein
MDFIWSETIGPWMKPLQHGTIRLVIECLATTSVFYARTVPIHRYQVGISCPAVNKRQHLPEFKLARNYWNEALNLLWPRSIFHRARRQVQSARGNAADFSMMAAKVRISHNRRWHGRSNKGDVSLESFRHSHSRQTAGAAGRTLILAN